MPPRTATPQRRSRAEYQAKYPKTVASLNRDQEKRLTCVDVPAAHGIHVRTTNPVESPFSTVRWRQRVTKGAGYVRRGWSWRTRCW
jgi:transposase-like protein